MNHKEYIIPIGEEAKEFDEMFIGVIRKQPELIRCKDCKYYRGYAGVVDGYCYMAEWYKRYQYPDDFCSRAERKEE